MPATVRQDKVALEFLTIRERIRGLEVPPFDRVVGIATGENGPASLLVYELNLPLSLLKVWEDVNPYHLY